jgi:hypothetical protein
MNLTIHYPTLNSLPLVLILTHITPVHAFPCYIFNIHLHIIFTAMPRPSMQSLSFRFPFHHINNVTYPVHPILLNLITPLTRSEEYKSRSSLLLYFLQPPVTSSLISQNIFLSTLCFSTLSHQVDLVNFTPTPHNRYNQWHR